MKLAIINSYFDFDDYENPVKTYLEDMNIISFLPSTTKRVSYDIQHNTAELKENLVFNVFTQSKEFYSIGERIYASENFNFNSQAYVAIYFKMSQISEVYERTVFTLFDMFGLLGGVFGILSTFGFIIVSSLSVKLFNNSLLSKLYQIKVPKKSRPLQSMKLTTNIFDGREL
jgi:hypothetical protein